ncbi:MAG: hypothetical protein RDV48_08585 [Candidatus Eremiobacteraeota bacterium]|nr:hypothetical protein [Candidatus Eremiobacteraeota bacterium]
MAKRRACAAFTLIEVIFGLWIATIVVLSVMMCLGYTYSKVSKNRAIATSIAKKIIEEYKGNPKKLSQDAHSASLALPSEFVQDVETGDILEYTREVIIGLVSGRLYKVVVKVSWSDKTGRKEALLDTLLLEQ